MTVGDGDFTAVAARDIRTSGIVSMPRDGGFTLDAGRSVVVNQNISRHGGRRHRDRGGDRAGAADRAAGRQSRRLDRHRPAQPALARGLGGAAPDRPGCGQQHPGVLELGLGRRLGRRADLLEGGEQGGRWVRLGQLGSSADVTLTAPRIKLRGGSVGNTFAEVVSGPGGSVTLVASDRIWVQNGAGDQARVQTAGGAPLTLLGETQLWDGPVRAGNGANNGGDVVIAGAVTASFQPQFSLAPGADFTFLPAAPEGAASSCASTQPFVVTTSGAGAIEIDAPVAAQQITLESEERVGLGPRGRLTGEAAGDALVVAAGRRFRNDFVGRRRRARRDRPGRPLAALSRRLRRPDRTGPGAAGVRPLRPDLRRRTADAARL